MTFYISIILPCSRWIFVDTMMNGESLNIEAPAGYDTSIFDDDGRPKRTGKYLLKFLKKNEQMIFLVFLSVL